MAESLEQSVKRSAEQSAEQSVKQSKEQSVKQSKEQSAEHSADQSAAPSDEHVRGERGCPGGNSGGAARTRPCAGVRLVRDSELAAAVDYAYAAYADLAEGGERPVRAVWTAGACPLDADGRTVAGGDVAAQARQVMSNLRQALSSAGATLDDVVKTTVYVASADRTDLVSAWRVVREHMGDHDAPSTLLGVAVLGYPDQLVEVEAVAVVAVAAGD
ncbi:hypothetical protein GCM10023224_14570 [Streptomonospora halophila]|uniref:Enamine deaminase RidA, house cleaning of reactive enamine intermediates, YjgF/YER057c/UK114 family n=1 Tax=Streptomonospora halophila TaxID=427369 RepID=A0ABP9GA40_9ACTN